MFDNLRDAGWGVIILVIVLVLALAFGIACLEAWILMLLWNAVACAIFPTLPTIGFWMAFGAMLLCNILFGRTVVTHKNN